MADRLPDDILEYLRVRRRAFRPVCPRCGRRPIEDRRTGWCGRCAQAHEREAEED